MKKYMLIAGSLVLLLVALAACQTEPEIAPTVESQAVGPEISLTTAPPEEVERALYRAEPYFIGAAFPLALEFGPDGSLWYGEKNGGIRRITPDGQLVPQPIFTFPVDTSGERGLMNFTLDPNFAENGYLWAFYTANDALVNRIGRITVVDDVGSDLQIAFEAPIAFETSTILNGGGLSFGPDGMLYIGIGSTNNVFASNEPYSPQGKIHRVTPTIPALPAPGNPEPDSTIYARGFRNAFGMAFDPYTGRLWVTENGGDCDDELNVVYAGDDAGWHINGECIDNALPPDYPYAPPVLYYTPPISPTGITIYNGDLFPEYQGDILFCSWHGARMIRVKLQEGSDRLIKTTDLLETAPFDCRLDVVTGPDGAIYYSDITSIYRLVRNDP